MSSISRPECSQVQQYRHTLLLPSCLLKLRSSLSICTWLLHGFMLGLRTVSWERIVISAPLSLMVRKTAHDFPIGKNQPKGVTHLGLECSEFLCDKLEAEIEMLY